MNEKDIIILILAGLGYICSFGFGYFLCKSRKAGLADNTGVCDQLSDSIKGSSDTAGELADRLGKVIESGGDLEDIFLKYARESEEAAEMEQDTDRGDSDILND